MDKDQINRIEQSILNLEKTVRGQREELDRIKQMLDTVVLQPNQNSIDPPISLRMQPPVQPPIPPQIPQSVQRPIPPAPGVMQPQIQQPAQPGVQPVPQPIPPQMQPQIQQPAQPGVQPVPQPIPPQMQQPIQQPVMPQSAVPPISQPPITPQVNPADYGLGSNAYANMRQRYAGMENKIGMSMGIVASVLVFVGIVLFVTLVYSSLTDIIKVACIFIFSFSVLAFGTFLMRRRVNAFTMSVAGCGMGAVYLSLFVTHIYFGMIDKFVLYLLIALWAVLVYFFFSKRSYAFKLIGQIGIIFSVLFGCASLAALGIAAEGRADRYVYMKEWWSQYYFLLIFFIATSVFYLLVKRETSVIKAAPLVILDYIPIMVLTYLGINRINSPAIVLACISAAYMFFLLFFYVLTAEKNNKNNVSGIIYVIMSAATCRFLFYVTGELGLPDDGAAVFFLKLTVLGAALAAEIIRGYKKADGDGIHIAMMILLYILLLRNTLRFELLYRVAGSGLYILPMLAVAYRFKDKTALWLSYITMFLFMLGGGDLLTVNVILALVSISVSGYLLYRDRQMYHAGFKCIWYLISLSLLITSFSQVMSRLDIKIMTCLAWDYILAAAVNTAAVHAGFANDWRDAGRKREKDVICILGIVNIGLMLFGIPLMRYHYDMWLRLLILAVAAAVYTNNIKTIYESAGENPLSGIYTGAKLSLFVFAALRAYSFSGPYLSIGWIILSIALILGGFKWQYRYLRMYGLFLSMFAIMKLIVFDINYENPLIRAASFIISGGLCFIISLVYNAYNKKG